MTDSNHETPDIEEHLAWAHLIALPYAVQQNINVEDSEEYADACLGFVRASKRFDSENGASFFTYSAKAAKNELMAGRIARQKARGIRESQSVFKQVTQYTLEMHVDRRGEQSGITQEKIAEFMDAVNTLPDRDREMMMLRIEGNTHQEVGRVFDVSKEISSRSERRSKMTLQGKLRHDFLLQ